MRNIKWEKVPFDPNYMRKMSLKMKEIDKFFKALQRLEATQDKIGVLISGAPEDIEFVQDFISRVQLPEEEIRRHGNA